MRDLTALARQVHVAALSFVSVSTEVDMVPNQFADKVKGLLDRDLKEHDLFVQSTGSRGQGLYTSKPVSDGDVILTPSYLLFSSQQTLLRFLRQPGHEQYMDCVPSTKVPNMKNTCNSNSNVQHFRWESSRSCG